jgi:hypothetical protein
VPIRSNYDECGLLLREASCLILRRDDGGRWRLEADGDAEKLVGQRVRVMGVRSGFDILEVRRITYA